ncbi:uncharacterized protein LOC105202672 [Solenopsis invicta]|uniref:uncharacterized protein LOC105202672 n=1 Tax=Solenopsis invicta TaxID=13686 RepID=UPI000595C008|nr:uncharacterized protein LOC105202672 [Solenopsis invicta]
MTDSKNVTCTKNTKNPDVPDRSSLIAYGNKSVELRLMKDSINMYRDSFLEREKILEEEKRKLEELNYQVWSLEDSLCGQVWQFSHKHNFGDIFQYHPFVTDNAKRGNYKNTDMERSSKLIDLTNKIDAIKKEMIALNQRRNVKREVESALIKLGKLQLISDEVTELLRLICPSESSCKFETISMPIYDEMVPNHVNKVKRRRNDPDRTKHVENVRSNLVPKDKSITLRTDKPPLMHRKEFIFTTPTNYPQLSLERSLILTANTVIMNASAESSRNEKLKNFTLKKRSEISIRFQQYHKHK